MDDIQFTIGTSTADTPGVVVDIRQGAFVFQGTFAPHEARTLGTGILDAAMEAELGNVEDDLTFAAGGLAERDIVRRPFDADEFARFCADPKRREMVQRLLDSLADEDAS